MIKATELRIGNLIKPERARHEEEFITVESISSNEVNLEFRTYNLSECNPIPLTSQHLIDFGFEAPKNPEPVYEFKRELPKDRTLMLHNMKEHGFFVYINIPLTRIADIKFVHQLQNLYFALTGTELELK